MKLDGEYVIPTVTDEGHHRDIVFQNLEVAMPIISVPMLCQHSDVGFKKRGGTIKHRESGETSHFIKRSGVYFIKLKVKRSLVDGRGNSQHEGDPNMPFVGQAVP